MKKQNLLTGFLLVGFGIFFLLRQFSISLFQSYYSWPTLLIIIGAAFLIYSYTAKEYQNIFIGSLLLLLGIHFHGLTHFSFWVDHWAIYPLIIGVSFLLRYTKTKSGLFPGLILTGLAVFALAANPVWLHWMAQFVILLEKFWPIVLIAIGMYMLIRKK